MSIQVETKDFGLVDLIIDIDNAKKGIVGRVADVFVASAPTFVRTAKRLTPVDTGALQRSLDSRVNRRMPRLRFGTLKRSINPKSGKDAKTYARFVHGGTARVGPRPFLTQSLKRHTTPQGAFMRGMRKAGIANIGKSTGGLR